MQYLKCAITSLLSIGLASFILVLFLSPQSFAVSVRNEPKTDIWQGYATLKRACSCESNGDPNKTPRQFNTNGTLLVGYPNPLDVGACQIHLPAWGAKAKEMNLDIKGSLTDNITMAKYILKVQGMGAWRASEKCWE